MGQFLTLRQDHRLKVFTNSAEEYICTQEEVSKRMLEKSAHCGTSLCTPHQIKVDEIDMACDTHGGEENCIWILVGMPDEKGTLGSPKHTWKYIILYHKEDGRT